MEGIFKNTAPNIELRELKYESLKKPETNGIVNLNVKDCVKIEKDKNLCTLIVSRALSIKDDVLFRINISLTSKKLLQNENLSIEEIKDYLLKNKDYELQYEMTYLSLLITQNTLLSPLKAVVTPPVFDGEII